jgi:putative DNA primase/helicase
VREQYKPEQHTFVNAIFRGLPKGYVLTENRIGVAQDGFKARPICSPLRVKALTERKKDGEVGFLVEFLTRDQALVECIVPNGPVQTNPKRAVEVLAKRGLMLESHYDCELMARLIGRWENVPKVVEIDQIGWTDD